MRQMEYRKERGIIVLDKGITDGFNWCIVSLGTHPVAYIAVKRGHPAYNKQYDELDIYCHGGLTYADDDLLFNPLVNSLHWIGWDYAHCDDYMGYYKDNPEMQKVFGKEQRKWTTEEIKAEVMEVIKQLKNMKTKKVRR